MKDGDYIQVQLSDFSVVYGVYKTDGERPYISYIDKITGQLLRIPMDDVDYPKLAGRYNPRNTRPGDIVVYKGDQRVVDGHVGHGVRLTEDANNKTSFIAFSIIEKNLSANTRFMTDIKALTNI